MIKLIFFITLMTNFSKSQNVIDDVAFIKLGLYCERDEILNF